MSGRDADEMVRIFEEHAEMYRRGGDHEQAREAQARADVWRAFAATDWSGPNPENGFYPGARSPEAGGVDPESWDHQRRMTAVELLRGHLVGGYGWDLPALWEPLEQNPVPEHLPDADWSELRAEMVGRARETAVRLVDDADKHARRKYSLSVGELSAFYGRPEPDERAAFFAANAVDGDLKPEVQARKLEAYARRAREIQKLYADLAAGLEDEHV